MTKLRERLHADDDPTWPVFASAGRDGEQTYRWPSTVRRSVRAVREKVDLDWMTPHTWRRTYATILDNEMSLTDRAKADLMGQAKFLKDTYVSRGELHPPLRSSSTPHFGDLCSSAEGIGHDARRMIDLGLPSLAWKTADTRL